MRTSRILLALAVLSVGGWFAYGLGAGYFGEGLSDPWNVLVSVSVGLAVVAVSWVIAFERIQPKELDDDEALALACKELKAMRQERDT